MRESRMVLLYGQIQPHWNGTVLVPIWGINWATYWASKTIWRVKMESPREILDFWVAKTPAAPPPPRPDHSHTFSCLLQTTPSKRSIFSYTSGHYTSWWVLTVPTGFFPLLLTNNETKLNLEISNIYSVLSKFLHIFFNWNNRVNYTQEQIFCGMAIRINIKYHNNTSLREYPVFFGSSF